MSCASAERCIIRIWRPGWWDTECYSCGLRTRWRYRLTFVSQLQYHVTPSQSNQLSLPQQCDRFLLRHSCMPRHALCIATTTNINQSISQSVSQSIDRSIDDLSIGQSVCLSDCLSVGQSIILSHSVSQSVSQSINQSINELTWINQANESVNQLTIQGL